MNIIPLPNQISQDNAELFIFKNDLKISYSKDLESSVNYFLEIVKKKSNLQIETNINGNINFLLDFDLNEEAYQIIITNSSINVKARTCQGAFYAVTTFIQLFIYKDGYLCLPTLEINDCPRFSYRGFMLDVARHFFEKEIIYKIIDEISLLKLNYLHLHLTDDQGWRIEIDKYPNLTKIGSNRNGTIINKVLRVNQSDHGYYTKNDLRDIVNYAKSKYIEVIPEIDMPGHMEALINSYPELECKTNTPKNIEMKSSFGISKRVLCVGNEKVYQMLEEILEEIIAIFPSKYIHLGGDEVVTKSWKKCKKCQALKKRENLKRTKDLQAYFFNYFTSFLQEHGKTVIGWNDCINQHLSNHVIIQHWKPLTKQKTVKEANNGRKIILSNFLYLYIDYPYAMTPLEKTYAFNPYLKGLTNFGSILGIEAPLWTERVENPLKIDFQIFPRLLAVSEIGWTNDENKNYHDFLGRLNHYYTHLDQSKINYAKNQEIKPYILKRVRITKKWLKDHNIEYNKN